METKNVIIQDGEYLCYIDITVSEWKEILQDNNFERYLNTLLMFYSEPDHKSTCKDLGMKYNVTAQSLSGKITNFAKAVQKRLSRFKILGTDDKPSYWIIPMKGRYVNGYFEWTVREELVIAIKELGLKSINVLQKIYNNAIEEEHWVFFDWFPSYEKSVNEYIEQGKNGNWSENIFQRLVKDTTNNGISDLQQGNFTWDEFEKITNNWSQIQYVIKQIAEKNEIHKSQYQEIETFFGNQTSGNRPSGTNRVIAAFLPNFVTTVVNYKYLKKIIINLKKILPDYPSSHGNWLDDNLEFIRYCNSKVKFEHPWHSSLFAWYLKEHFENESRILQEEEETMQYYIDLLINNKNLILTGAPGTGKTYLAKQIATAINAEVEFVQFHPSYDYTDFVEGLRPIRSDNSELGFELKDGILKSFCRHAINDGKRDNFEEKFTEFIDELSESPVLFETPTHKKKFKVEINSNRTCVAIPDTDIGTRMSITKEMIKDYILSGKIRVWKPYTVAIAEYFKKNYKVNVEEISHDEKPYVLIIDEINRAEISKVFGELFFSLDPGYRGIEGRVKTQYSNLQDESDVFADGFYIPENVYIIGTMNDIDRSVESFDFAMRRRFAWKEIKAIDRISMWDGNIDEWIDEAHSRMSSLNTKIESIQSLGAEFHIGPAYFLKLKNYEGDFDLLWENHLHGVLFEYLRGFPDNKKLLEELRTVYDNPVIDSE